MIPAQWTRLVFLVVFLAVAGCNTGSSNSEGEPARETLENGALLVRYADFPLSETTPVDADLRIGVGEGEPEYMFGDVRGFDAAQSGTVFVLDYQAAEILAYDETGAFIRTVATAGPGPDEISQANGMVLRGDSVLWIQDHGQWLMKGFGLDGRLLDSYEMPIRSRGYVWEGLVDNDGVSWKRVDVTQSPRQRRPDAGLNESSSEQYYVGVNPRSERRDSVHVGSRQFRYFVVDLGNGFAHMPIPHDPATEVALDPDGGFWQADTDVYRIAKLSETGDTTLVIHVDASPVPVTDEDAREFTDSFLGQFEDRTDLAGEIIGLMPENKPIIVDLVVDDVSRLWVRRQDESQADTEEHPRFDVFEQDGAYVGSVRLPYPIVPYMSIRVRNNRIYALSFAESGVPSIVRSTPVEFNGRM